MGGYNSKYYELDKIKPYRFVAIDNAIKEFKKVFNLKSPPYDLINLSITINEQTNFWIKLLTTGDLDAKVYGRTMYLHHKNLYLVSINKNQFINPISGRVKYPFKYSSDRMVNFTLAHEFGHIFLKHAEIPDSLKSKKIQAEEDLEADEFAGRLLMPKSTIENCSFRSSSEVSAKFLVSDQALYKRLLHLDLLHKRKSDPVSVCPNCWNNDITSYYDFCPVCGIPLHDKNGVFALTYSDSYNVDLNGRAFPCPKCGNDHYGKDDESCNVCGSGLVNMCTNPTCSTFYLNDGESRYCNDCGSPTTFLRDGILNDWIISKEISIGLIEAEEEICGPKIKAFPLYDWDAILMFCSNFWDIFISECLKNSRAKIAGKKLLIYLQDWTTNKILDDENYKNHLINILVIHVAMDIEEIHFIAYEENKPVASFGLGMNVPF
ncbi:MAG: ImmA/IrrE family metallo-endopeptidase [Eubacteriaceae bacterium]|nr:ImmA/IrrE family metallo-endopeptidase [Eubacteriaceae bacterium]